MRYEYFRQWNSILKQPMRVLSPSAAKKRYEAGDPFGISAHDDDGRLVALIAVGGFAMTVQFQDEAGKTDLEYYFVDSGTRMMFLKSANIHEFDESSGARIRSTSFSFTPEGEVEIEIDETGSPNLLVSKSVADVSANFEVFPDFDSIERVLNRERPPVQVPPMS